MRFPVPSPTARRSPQRIALRALACCLLIVAASAAAHADLWDARDELIAAHRSRLTAFADECAEQGLAEVAASARRKAEPLDPSRIHLVLIDEVSLSHESSSGEGDTGDDPAAAAATRLERLNRDYADELFDLARRAVRARQASLAYELVLASLRENPDHEAARRLLGYQKFRGGWHTRYEIAKTRDGLVDHPTFGWILKKHVPRYETGERFVGNRWISAEEDAQRHLDIRRGWQVETEHFQVITNHSLESGVDLGRRLEQLYRAWQQTFAGYYATQDELLQLFAGRRSSRPRRTSFRVIYFANREQYQQALADHLPPGVETQGIYIADHRAAYFFADDRIGYRTLFHEATHQLCFESRNVRRDAGGPGNYWIVEGIAMYMETLAKHGDHYTLGGYDNPRMVAAQIRALADDDRQFYVPLAELTVMGQLEFQQHPRIAELYSQGAGMTHFLMHNREGRYRDALLAYLFAVFSGRHNPRTLANLTGQPLDVLDRQYFEFLKRIPVDDSAPSISAQRPATTSISEPLRVQRVKRTTVEAR